MTMSLQQSDLDGSKMYNSLIVCKQTCFGLCAHRHHPDTHQHHLSRQLEEIKVLKHNFSANLTANHIDVFLSSIKTKAPTNIQAAVL